VGSNDRFCGPRWDAFSACGARVGSSGWTRVDHSFNDGLGDRGLGFWRTHEVPGFAVWLEGGRLESRPEMDSAAIFYQLHWKDIPNAFGEKVGNQEVNVIARI
jgi:hypothetical protein